MKRIVTLLLAAGMLMGGASASQAVDVKVSGNWQFGFEWANASWTKPKTQDTFNAVQRFRTQVDLISSESLKGVVFFEIGKNTWGKGRGGGVGSDGYDVKLRYSYVDWMVPQTDLKVRMGIQPFLLPNFVAGENVLGTDAAGITLSYQFNDMVGATLFWMRATDDNYNLSPSKQNDSSDFFGLTVPVKGDGFKVTPWGMIGSVGNNSLQTSATLVNDKPQDLAYMAQGLLPWGSSTLLPANGKSYRSPWWLGIGGELTMFAPFRIAGEFRYGQSDFGSVDLGTRTFELDRSGWYAGLIAEYKLDFMTPGLIFWYTSGDDSNPYNGSERMPYATENSNGGWSASNFGFDGQSDYGVSQRYDAIGQTNIGTWGIMAQLKDISFLQDLKHTLKFGFYQGTNNKNMPQNAGMTTYLGANSNGYSAPNVDALYLTTKDNAWEVDFVTNYMIYKDLALSIDLAYVRLNMDSGVWKDIMGSAWDNRSKNAYRVGAYMKYTF